MALARSITKQLLDGYSVLGQPVSKVLTCRIVGIRMVLTGNKAVYDCPCLIASLRAVHRVCTLISPYAAGVECVIEIRESWVGPLDFEVPHLIQAVVTADSASSKAGDQRGKQKATCGHSMKWCSNSGRMTHWNRSWISAGTCQCFPVRIHLAEDSSFVHRRRGVVSVLL